MSWLTEKYTEWKESVDWDRVAFMVNSTEDYREYAEKQRAKVEAESARHSALVELNLHAARTTYETEQYRVMTVMLGINEALAKRALEGGMLAADFSRMNFEREMVGVEAFKKYLFDNAEIAHLLAQSRLKVDESLRAKELEYGLTRRLGAPDSR